MQDTIRVLYVDDEPALLEIGKLFLETGGNFVVDILASATGALTCITAERYDAIISDYQMPDMDGIEFLRRVRSSGNAIPFILFTGRGREEVVIEAINNGADFYLQKGGQPRAQFAELAHKVRQAVQRKRAEILLQKSEERYRSVVNDQTEMICRFTPDGTVTFTNEAYRQYFLHVLTLTDIEGKNIHDLMQLGNYEEVDSFLGSLTPETPILEMERAVTGRDDKRYWQLWSVRALFDTDGKTVEYQVVGRDITEQKMALAALADSESRLRSFIETTREAVILVDEEGNVIEWNPGAERISGIAKEEALGSFIWDLMFRMLPREHRTEKRRADIEQTILTTLRTGVPGFEKTRIVEAERPDGTRILTRQTIFPIKTGKGFRFGSVAQDITSEKREEDAVRESEAKYRELADLLPQMIFEMDLDFRITYANRHALTTMGFTEQDLKDGVNALSLIEPSQQVQVKENMQKQLNGISPEPREYAALRKDGSTIPVIIYSAPIYRNRELAGFRGVIIDITAQKKKDAELRESEEKYRLVVENGDNVVFIFRDSRILFANPMATDLTGYTADELISMNIWDLVHPDDRSRMQESAKRRISGSTLPPDFTGRIITKSGEILDCAFFVNRILYQDQPALLGIIRDISEHKKVEEALRESEERFRGMAERSSELIIILDEGMSPTYVSPSARSITGYDPEELVGKSPDFAMATIFSQSGSELMNAVQKTVAGVPVDNVELQLRKKDGSPAYVTMQAVPILHDGVLAGAQVSMRDNTERRRIETALRESEAKYRLLADNVHDMIWTADKDMRITYISPSVMALRGITPEEAMAEPISDALTPESYRALMLSRQQGLDAMRNGEPHPASQSLKLEFRRRDGSTVWTETVTTPTFDSGGAFAGVVGVTRDISEQKKVDEAMRKSEQQFRALFENANDAITVYGFTPDGLPSRFIKVNENACRLSGYTREEMLSMSPLDLYDPETRKAAQRAIQKLMEQGDMVFERTHVRKDGQKIPVEISAHVFLLDDQKVVLSIIRDITERKRAEEVLRESEEKYRSIVETSPNMIWEVDAQGNFRYMSPIVQTIMGYTPEEIVGRSITDLVPEQVKPFAVQELARFVSSEGSLIPLEVPARHRTGRDIILEIRPARLTGTYGKVDGFRGVAVDITERKKVEEALRLANRKLNLLTSITRHDISNQLTVLQGYCELLEESEKDLTLNEYCRGVMAAAERISSIIRFTKDYEEIGINAPAWQDFRLLLDTEIMQVSLGNVVVENTIPTGMEVFADPLVVRVFYNLMDNAVRYGGKITTIRFSVEDRNDDMIIICEDDGIGVSADEKKRIFELGFGKNTGLGLALSREILAITGITIDENGEPGKGARFEITVPGGMYRFADRWPKNAGYSG